MRIYQVLSSFSYGDAIGNVVCAMKAVVKQMGYETEVFAETIDSKLPAGSGILINKMPDLKPDDIVIYHLSNGTKLNRLFGKWNCRKIVYYHNITPPDFFEGYNPGAQLDCHKGLRDAKYLADKVDYCLAVSEFNRQNLIEMGYRQKIDVLPILIPYQDYKQEPDMEIINKYSDGNTNILFAGRIVPNKKFEDIIQSFYYYKKYINTGARLFLVGKHGEADVYYEELVSYVKRLELEDVYFTGHIKFNQILAYYHIANIFMCLSEHEGFCVPLVEAMYFGIPIIAYNSSAIADTLGDGGMLTNDKSPKLVAEMVDCLVSNQKVREYIIEQQKKQLQRFEYDRVTGLFELYLKRFLAEGQGEN